MVEVTELWLQVETTIFPKSMHSMCQWGSALWILPKFAVCAFWRGGRHDPHCTEACWSHTWGRQYLAVPAEIPQVPEAPPLKISAPWIIVLWTCDVSGSSDYHLYSSIFLENSSWLLLRRPIHTNLIKEQLGQTLSVLVFCNMVRLRIFQTFKSASFLPNNSVFKTFPSSYILL